MLIRCLLNSERTGSTSEVVGSGCEQCNGCTKMPQPVNSRNCFGWNFPLDSREADRADIARAPLEEEAEVIIIVCRNPMLLLCILQHLDGCECAFSEEVVSGVGAVEGGGGLLAFLEEAAGWEDDVLPDVSERLSFGGGVAEGREDEADEVGGEVGW